MQVEMKQKIPVEAKPKIPVDAKPKMPVDMKPNYPTIPSNLKNLPSAISVTTVQKPKMSSQPPWDRNAAFAGMPKPPTAVKNHHGKDKTKSKLDQSRSKVVPKFDRSFAKPPPSKEKTYKVKVADHKIDVKLDKGLCIIPVLKEPKITPAQLPKPVAKVALGVPKPKQLPDMIAVGKERPSLVITPVDNKSQPTLQQKLAAKQLANTARSSSGSGPVKTTKPTTSKAGSSSFDGSHNLGSSGVSIFPLPVDTNPAKYSGTQLPMPPFHSQHPLYVSNTTPLSKYPAHVSVSAATSKSKPNKKSDVLDLNRLKAFNKGLIIEQTSRRKPVDEKLKHTLKALEDSPGIIITPKITKKSLVEVLSIE